MKAKLAGADAPFEIVWDQTGIVHVFAESVADAYRGMGYAAGSERLWQIHLSTAFANGRAAELLGERFVSQDALQRACNVGGCGEALPASDGDWIVDAYLDGLNSVVGGLADVPAEFVAAGAEPRPFTRADVAARYRFTCWFQHKSWTEKMVLGRLMATHGIDYFREHVLHFTAADEEVVTELGEALKILDPAPLSLAYPEVSPTALSGSNNWAIVSSLSASGKPMLATDPHQPHSIPNTFFYAHLHAGDWDAFGAAFPGVPYFMMGYTRDVAWGLTTGFVDCYDVFVEELRAGQYRNAGGWEPLQRSVEQIAVRGGTTREIEVLRTPRGPLLEPLTAQLGLNESPHPRWQTALHWSLTDIPTSAGALACLPLAGSAVEFGEALFEGDVCPLVNNIICVDRDDHLRRFIAAVLPARRGVSGSVPLPGWDSRYQFDRSTAAQLLAEEDPASGYCLTANNDTMGESGDFYIHNFPAPGARAERIRQLLEEGDGFTVSDFMAMQLDLTDLRAGALLPDLLEVLRKSADPDVIVATELLESWNFEATVESAAACLFYPFLDRFWQRAFMQEVLEDNLINALPVGAPGLNRFDIGHFLRPGSPWRVHRDALENCVIEAMRQVVQDVRKSLGDDSARWRWGDLHQIAFQHSLARRETWRHMRIGPDPIGGSGTTLAMAMHMGKGPGGDPDDAVPCRVYHGPAFRLIVDLGEPERAHFVIAGGNGGRPDSPFVTNQYPAWLAGEYHRIVWSRQELAEAESWLFEP